MEYKINILILMLLLTGCAITSYTDIKRGKISNHIVIFYGCIISALNIIQQVIFNLEIDGYMINVVVVIVVAVALYFLHIWAGGDCKLMIFISMAMPPSYYWNMNLGKCTLWYIYAFIFSLGLIFIFIESIICLLRKKNQVKFNEIKKDLKACLLKYIKVVVYMAGFWHLVNLWILPNMNLRSEVVLLFGIIAILLINKIKFLSSIYLIIIIAIFDLIMTVCTGNVTVNTLWYVYMLTLIFMILRVIANKFNYEEIDIAELKEGMILSTSTTIVMKKSRVAGLPDISDETLKSRLNREEIESIKRWQYSKYGCNKVVIAKKIPFAIFITFGLAVYLILGCVLF